MQSRTTTQLSGLLKPWRLAGQCPIQPTHPGSSRVSLHLPSVTIPAVLKYIARCPDRHFVTLTTKRRCDGISLSREVGQTLHRVNRALFGTAYSRRGEARLATYAVQEAHLSDGLHCHLQIGVPEGSLAMKVNRPALPVPLLILKTWCKLDPLYRKLAAQDYAEIYDPGRLTSYMHKDVWTLAHFDNVDVGNTNIPKIPALSL